MTMPLAGAEENNKENCHHTPEEFAGKNSCAESLESVSEDKKRWETVTHSSYLAPQPDPSRFLGRRRELVRNFLERRVYEATINAIVPDPPLEQTGPSEYADNFCDSEFVPFMNRTEYDSRKHVKYPLHGGATVQSYYKCQLDRGTLKTRSEILDFNQPFRRSCAFTTPPDLALREPTGGY